MLNVKKLLTKLLAKTIVENSANNYITVGNFAMCWGYKDIPNISQNAYATLTPAFPITFMAKPLVIPFFATGMGSGRNMLMQAPAGSQSTTQGSIIVINNGIAFTLATNGCGWVAIGFIGGGYFLKVFSRLAERRWEYAERKETPHENNVCDGHSTQGYIDNEEYWQNGRKQCVYFCANGKWLHVLMLAVISHIRLGFSNLHIRPVERKYKYLVGNNKWNRHRYSGCIRTLYKDPVTISERGWSCA